MNVSAKRVFPGRRLPALAFGMTLGLLASSAAWAQAALDSPVVATGRANRAAAQLNKAPMQAPEAIPGAKPREDAAPATRAAGDLQPTDALFDAINRGDIASARDAINRGADMHGVNILGMTPMELSVDLGRNDISFLLLSMRGEDSDRGARTVGHEAPTTGKVAPAGKPATAGNAEQNKVARARPVAPMPVVARPVAPKLFANDGGAPLPSAGFLGFGSGSASN